jgi:hypothetical protein
MAGIFPAGLWVYALLIGGLRLGSGPVGVTALRQLLGDGCQPLVLPRNFQELQAHRFAGRPVSPMANPHRFDPIALGVGLA